MPDHFSFFADPSNLHNLDNLFRTLRNCRVQWLGSYPDELVNIAEGNEQLIAEMKELYQMRSIEN